MYQVHYNNEEEEEVGGSFWQIIPFFGSLVEIFLTQEMRVSEGRGCGVWGCYNKKKESSAQSVPTRRRRRVRLRTTGAAS